VEREVMMLPEKQKENCESVGCAPLKVE